MSNPFRRWWPLMWRGEHEAKYQKNHWAAIDVAALRIRHGARAACKRLRGERDEAREFRAGMLKDLVSDAEAERDAARLELRALEWLLNNRFIAFRDEGRVWAGVRLPDETMFSYVDYAAAARALGWEG